VTTPFEWTTYILWVVIVAAGLAIAASAFRAWRTTRSRSLGILGVGFLLISVSAALLWLTLYVTVHDPMVSEVAATASMAAGLVTVLVSLHLRTP
jgi:tryptophan-rich sensory protein